MIYLLGVTVCFTYFIGKNYTNNTSPVKQEWIDWANDIADWLGPLINKPHAILDVK
jgi:hypothetical protein